MKREPAFYVVLRDPDEWPFPCWLVEATGRDNTKGGTSIMDAKTTEPKPEGKPIQRSLLDVFRAAVAGHKWLETRMQPALAPGPAIQKKHKRKPQGRGLLAMIRKTRKLHAAKRRAMRKARMGRKLPNGRLARLCQHEPLRGNLKWK